MSPSGLPWALSLLVLAGITQGESQVWNEATCAAKFAECHNLLSGVGGCSQYSQTIQCFDNYTVNGCTEQLLSLPFWKNETITKYCQLNCYSDVSATLQTCIESFSTEPPPPPPTPPPPNVTENCTYSTLPAPPHPPLTFLGLPSLSPPPSTADCTLPVYQTSYRQHCSLFSLSHLRSFGDRSLPLQTCILYGKVYLLKHRSLSVSVYGEHRLGNSDFYTFITEVNVTLHSHSCFQPTVTYTATVSTLPDSIPGYDPTRHPQLQLKVENKTMATILAPWINTSIVIHRTEGYLSVTLQVPEPLTRVNEVAGLCSQGCPDGFEVSDAALALPDYQCSQNKPNTAILCLELMMPTLPTSSSSYSELCVYDILLTHNLTLLLSLYKALAEDALMLPDVTQIIVTPPETTPPLTVTTQTSKYPQVTSIIVNPGSPPGGVGSSHATRPLWHLLACFLIVFLLLR